MPYSEALGQIIREQGRGLTSLTTCLKHILMHFEEVVAELLHKSVEENAHSALDQQEYQQRYTSLVERYEAVKDGLKKINDKRLERNAKRESIVAFIRELEERDILMNEFDEGLWITIVDAVVVHFEREITSTFRDGMESDWEI